MGVGPLAARMGGTPERLSLLILTLSGSRSYGRPNGQDPRATQSSPRVGVALVAARLGRTLERLSLGRPGPEMASKECLSQTGQGFDASKAV